MNKQKLLTKKKHEKSFLAKTLQLFEQTTMSFGISMNFQQKVPRFVKKQKIIDLAKTCNFSKKLPKIRKKSIFREKARKFCSKKLQKVFAKSCKKCFREKARKIIDLAKTCNFSNKLPCFDELSAKSELFSTKKLQKCFESASFSFR